MSTFKVTIERVTVYPHPNADLLELAEVGLYRAVVGKGQFVTGDYALYIPEQAVLPAGLIEELGLTGKLAGSNKDRVKAIRLRGELSQGIVCRPKSVGVPWDPAWFTPDAEIMSYDFAEELGITKWVPPIPVGMAGQVEGAPALIRWPDIENIKRYPDMFVPGEPVIATEKIHGTCCLLTYTQSSDQVFVTSKGFGGKNLAILPDDKNLYWRAVWQYGLADVARDLADMLDSPRVALFGEVFGAGVQDLHYGADGGRNDTLGYALFDVAVEAPDGGRVGFLDTVNVYSAAYPMLGRVPMAPVLYAGSYDYAVLAAVAEGREQVSGREAHIREGLVVRPLTERRHPELGRTIAKFVSDGYLTRGGDATEYE